MLNFDHKVVLVTGGGSGIGKATAEAFAACGATVVISDIAAEAGEATAAQLRAGGHTALFVHADVGNAAHVTNLMAEILATYGRLDIAINNAGVEGPLQRTAEASEETFDHIMAVNVKGVWLCLKEEINIMLAQGKGAIVNIASVAGLVGAHSLGIYSASKHAVIGLTRSAALEYARKGLRVNAVCPSFIRTPMVERGMTASPQFLESVIHNHPSRRVGEAAEVSAAILWLASDEASFVNGIALPVDGAFTAQ
ncbi:MAG: glucose 1-dehydrogenase [Chloroflexi bacterium]|nr:glucose 1-dehydrogenase [Chloroflexota bacterium]